MFGGKTTRKEGPFKIPGERPMIRYPLPVHFSEISFKLEIHDAVKNTPPFVIQNLGNIALNIVPSVVERNMKRIIANGDICKALGEEIFNLSYIDSLSHPFSKAIKNKFFVSLDELGHGTFSIAYLGFEIISNAEGSFTKRAVKYAKSDGDQVKF